MATLSNFFNGLVAWLSRALREESTWRGIIAIASATGASISPDLATQIIAVGMALIGAINVVKKQTPPSPPSQ